MSQKPPLLYTSIQNVFFREQRRVVHTLLTEDIECSPVAISMFSTHPHFPIPDPYTSHPRATKLGWNATQAWRVLAGRWTPHVGSRKQSMEWERGEVAVGCSCSPKEEPQGARGGQTDACDRRSDIPDDTLCDVSLDAAGPLRSSAADGMDEGRAAVDVEGVEEEEGAAADGGKAALERQHAAAGDGGGEVLDQHCQAVAGDEAEDQRCSAAAGGEAAVELRRLPSAAAGGEAAVELRWPPSAAAGVEAAVEQRRVPAADAGAAERRHAAAADGDGEDELVVQCC